MNTFLEQIRARKLDRLAVAYAVIGWILVQGASILLPTFAAPVWLLRFFIVAVVVGFPIALAVGWVLASDRVQASGSLRARWGKTHVALLSIGAVGAVVLSVAAFLLYGSGGEQVTP